MRQRLQQMIDISTMLIRIREFDVTTASQKKDRRFRRFRNCERFMQFIDIKIKVLFNQSY